jgi:hypothetical protein
MDENDPYDLTWRDDAELDALLLAAKITGLADLDGALDIWTGHRAILAQDPPAEMRTLARDAEMRDAQIEDRQAPRLSTW